MIPVAWVVAANWVTDREQIDPKAHETHPHAVPKDAKGKKGGWGHNPGFEGYGPIAMITGQGALDKAAPHTE